MTTTIVDNVTQSVISTPPIVSQPLLWKQQLGESYDWYARFLHFYLLQSRFNRSVLGAYRHYRIARDDITKVESKSISQPPHNWYDHASQYDWKSRAIAYDDHVDSQLLDNAQANARKAKAKRIQMIDLVGNSVMAYYESGEVKYDATSANATLKTILHQSREEYQPTQRHDNRTQIIALIGQLPADVQSVLRKRLKSAGK